MIDLVEARLEAVPSDISKIAHILNAPPFLISLGGAIQSYSKCMGIDY